MATYYWVGGSGTWDNSDKTHWAIVSNGAGGNGPPTSADTVNFDANSGTGTCTTASTAAASAVTLNSVNLGLTLSANFTIGGAFILTAGTFNLNNNVLTALTWNSTNANTRTLAFGTGNITLTGNAATLLSMSTTTGLTITGTPVFNATYSGSTGARAIGIALVTEATQPTVNITAGSDTVNLSNSTYYRNLNFTGFSGTLGNNTRTIYGNLTISSGMTLTAGANGTTFGATLGTQQITTNGKTLDFPITQDGVGGTVQLQDNLTMGSTRTFTLTNGTLDLNSKTLSTGVFSSSNANTRSIAFGTGNITCTGSAATVWTTGAATGFTYTGTPTVNCTYSGSTGTRIIIHGNGAGGSISNAINFNISAGSDAVSIASASYINNLDFTGFSGTMNNFGPNICGNYKLSSGMTVTAGATATTFLGTSTQQITCATKTLDFPITINGVGCVFQAQDTFTQGATRTLTLTNGSIDLNNQTFNTGFFSSNNSNVRGVTFGSGTFNVTGTTGNVWATDPTTNFTVSGTAVVNATNAGSTGTRTINPGTPTESQAISFNITAGSDTVALTGSRNFGGLDFTGFTGTLTNTAITVYGSLKLVVGMTLTAGANAWTFAATSAKQITTALKTLDFSLIFNGIGGVWTCQDALTLGSTRALTLTNGTLNLKAGATSTVGSLVTTGTNQKYLGSSTPGTQAVISAASGVNSVSYLTIQDSDAAGGAVWQAYYGNGNIDAGNNTDWDFGETPVLGAEYEYKLRSFTEHRRF